MEAFVKVHVMRLRRELLSELNLSTRPMVHTDKHVRAGLGMLDLSSKQCVGDLDAAGAAFGATMRRIRNLSDGRVKIR